MTLLINRSESLGNSYEDFHVYGFDYLCLQRSESLTKKVYFFKDIVTHAPEVVNPHNHRYHFDTTVLAGELANWRYHEEETPGCEGAIYERYDYLTPLNGGMGFSWDKKVKLWRGQAEQYGVGERHSHKAAEIHTISVRPGAVIELQQHADVVAKGRPTRTYFPEGQAAPNILGGYLYRPMRKRRWTELVKVYAALKGEKVEIIE